MRLLLALALLLCPAPHASHAQQRAPDALDGDTCGFLDAISPDVTLGGHFGAGLGSQHHNGAQRWSSIIEGRLLHHNGAQRWSSIIEGRLLHQTTLGPLWTFSQRWRLRGTLPTDCAPAQLEGDGALLVERPLSSYAGLQLGLKARHDGHLASSRLASSRLSALRDHTVGPSPHHDHGLRFERLPSLSWRSGKQGDSCHVECLW